MTQPRKAGNPPAFHPERMKKIMVVKTDHGKLFFDQIQSGYYIHSVIVEPGHRCHGEGTELMKKALAMCGSPVFLFASPEFGADMKRLKRFYRRFGFRPCDGKQYDTFPYKYNMILKED